MAMPCAPEVVTGWPALAIPLPVELNTESREPVSLVIHALPDASTATP